MPGALREYSAPCLQWQALISFKPFGYGIARINISVKLDSSTDPKTQEKPEMSAFAWHYDSFPFVFVTLLSDCSEIVGGETAITTPSREGKMIRGPAIGSQAISNWYELYLGFAEYRLEVLEEPLRLKMKEEQKRVHTKPLVHIADMTAIFEWTNFFYASYGC
ncbi:hypothetical protein BDV36DRAFT_292813 [Aspergillus pseudocaelatus]|uniref:Uncharacterized protein n=1 Tax=Aspergillus pseudocaelatus TaxID=1825620 RepID=A0ABQ6WUV1_9EURO|nr:hypothetical protein BDV36DRAFT_292813 [Aspergillus pseudocaelatus]